MMEVILEILKMCIPIIVGALIAIVPTMIEKATEYNHEKDEKQYQKKQEMYVELIALFSKVLKDEFNKENLYLLRNYINLISITGSVEVVKALNEYLDTWGKGSGEEQNRKYCELIKVIRVDLGIDKKINDEFPEIGLRDIRVKS